MSKKTLSDFLKIVLSNIIVLASSIITALVIPKLMGTTNYGYYKTYTLYMSYTALLHFGFVDGILLKHAGQEYDQLDRKPFRLNSKFYIVFQGLVALVIATFAILGFKGIYSFIALAIAVDTFSTNVTSYFQFVSQATMRFDELSKRKILYASCKLVATGIIVFIYYCGFIKQVPAQMYIFAIVAINAGLMIWYTHTYRDIVVGESNSFSQNKSILRSYFSTGIALTLSFQVSNLILSIDQQFVSSLFDKATYGVYAFAYSILNMATTIIGAISTVLLPNLKRRGVDTIQKDLPLGISGIFIIVFAGHVFYYLLIGFVSIVLPDYLPSLVYLRIILPGLALSSSISAILFNYYKVLNLQRKYFFICVFVLGLSATLNGIVYWIFRTPASISAASVVTLLVWYLLALRYFVKTYNVKWLKELLYVLIMGSSFYLITGIISDILIGTFAFLTIYLFVTFGFYKNVVIGFAESIKKK
jgi:O-antigen/teichoic acid export membrane protein